MADLDLSKLTPRERDVVAGVAAGATNRTIARRLGLREQTVKNHLSSVFEKLGVANRLELALCAVGARRPPEPPVSSTSPAPEPGD